MYHWCEQNDPINAYIWCCNLQGEADEWGGRFGIGDTDIFGAFDADDLAGFRRRAEAVEKNFLKAIEKNGVKLDEYETVEDFLAAN